MNPIRVKHALKGILCTLLASPSILTAQVLDFDPTSEGPWSDIEKTTLTVPLVANGSVSVDGTPNPSEYGGFEGVNVTPGENAWILDFPGDRAWDNAEDSSFTYWLAHDEDNFYIGVDVKDDIVNSDDPNAAFWKDDSIEIVVDALNDRYDNNTDNSNDPYGGHCYFNYEGRFSVWDDDAGARTDGRWSTAVDFTYAEDGDVWGVGGEVEGGWQLEVRFSKSLFEDPDAGNKLQDGYKMGFNIALDDDDKFGPGTNGSGDRSQDLELQYFWANRLRLLGWTADEALDFSEQEIADGVHELFYDLGINSAGRLSHGGTGEIIFSSEMASTPAPVDPGPSEPEPEPEPTPGGGAPSVVTTFDPTKTQMALPLAEPPTIDGVIDADESWALAGGAAQNFWKVSYDEALEDLFRGGVPGDSAELPFDANDLQYNIYAGVDDENLYVAVQVTDDFVESDTVEAGSENGQTWNDDSVEIFIDGDNSNFEERSTDGNPEVINTGGQFVITANNAYRHAEAGNPGYGPNDAWYAQADLTDDGWVAEFRISLDTIGNPSPGDVIGFTVGVNDDDFGGNAERQVLWVGSTHTEATYGNLIIGHRNYTAPKSATPTVDGTVNAEEYADAEEIILNMHTGSYHINVGNDEWEEGDHSLSAWVIHDDEAIYVAIDAIDDTISTDSAEAGSEDGQTWVDDSIEIFFDADESNIQGRDQEAMFEGQFVLTANGAFRDNEANNPKFAADGDWFGGVSETDKGYQMEFKVNKSALLGIGDGDTVGFNIAMNDDDGSGRKSQLNWAGAPHQEFSYGTLTLGGAAEPSTPTGPSPANVAIQISNGQVTLEWEGPGSLESASSVEGPWSVVEGAATGVSIPATDSAAFYRVR